MTNKFNEPAQTRASDAIELFTALGRQNERIKSKTITVKDVNRGQIPSLTMLKQIYWIKI